MNTRASSALYDSLCPGRAQAQDGIPEPEASEDAEYGRRLHSALAKGDPTGLTMDQRDTYDACQEVVERVLNDYFGHEAGNAKDRAERERELVILVDEFKHIGHPDIIYRWGTRALIPDFKGLFGDIPDAQTNKQLRDYCVMYDENTPLIEELATCIIQPRVSRTPKVCIYTRDDLGLAKFELFERVRASHNPNAPRIPGPVQCKFCLAARAGKCAEYNKWMSEKLPAPRTLFDVPVSQWKPEDRALFMDHKSIAQQWLDDCYKDMVEGSKLDPDYVPGYKLKDGANMFTEMKHILRTEKAQEILERFIAIGGTQDRFIRCVGVISSDFKEAVSEVTKLKGRPLDMKLKELYQGLVETKQNQPSLRAK